MAQASAEESDESPDGTPKDFYQPWHDGYVVTAKDEAENKFELNGANVELFIV